MRNQTWPCKVSKKKHECHVPLHRLNPCRRYLSHRFLGIQIIRHGLQAADCKICKKTRFLQHYVASCPLHRVSRLSTISCLRGLFEWFCSWYKNSLPPLSPDLFPVIFFHHHHNDPDLLPSLSVSPPKIQSFFLPISRTSENFAKHQSSTRTAAALQNGT